MTWWRSPFELAYVELDADGPVMPVRSVEAEGNAEFSPSLMNEALRDVWGD